jgi:hypothetical protein
MGESAKHPTTSTMGMKADRKNARSIEVRVNVFMVSFSSS